jgi:hypothetical protein
MSERILTKVLPEGVVHVWPDDHSEEWLATSLRARDALSEFYNTATEAEIAEANVVIDGFRNDFSCGKAIQVNVNCQTAYEAYDAEEKTLNYLLARNG